MQIFKTFPSICLNTRNLIYFSTTAASTKNTKKTYYQLLEVPSNATMANIKNNYLRLAKIYHPDVYKGKDKDRFQKIQEAYKVLIDKVKRVRYDEEIGISVNTDRGAEQQFARKNDGGSEQETGKPKNPMSYESSQQKIDLDEQYQKFFSQKPKTQFEQIRLNEEPQIRSMTEAERLRRHFTNVYQSPSTLNKAEYQKQFDTIINDQINQKNKMHDDKVKDEARVKQMNTQKGMKSAKMKIFLFFGVLCLVTFPVIMSYATKYRLEKERRNQIQEYDKKIERQAQQIDLRLRLKYE